MKREGEEAPEHKETGMGILVPIIGPIKHLRARGPKAVPGPTFISISFHSVVNGNTTATVSIVLVLRYRSN